MAEKMVDAREKYKVADIIDAVLSHDVPMLANAARMYPALVVSVMVDPMAVLRSFNGHKRARTMDAKLRRVLLFAEQQEKVQVLTEADSFVQVNLPAEEISVDESESEAARLLRAINEDDSVEGDEE